MRKWEFREELNELIEKKEKIKDTTFNQYLSKLFSEASKERLFNSYDKDWQEKRDQSYVDLQQACRALKEDKISFNGGFIRISNITEVESTDTHYHITTKEGSKMFLKRHFRYLRYVFFDDYSMYA